ncbi:MAG: TolB family protein [Planctomycetota bacterium]
MHAKRPSQLVVSISVFLFASTAEPLSAQVTQRVSLHSSGAQAHDDSGSGRISANGRYVMFGSDAADLVAGDLNGRYDVFVRDRQTGMTERISVDSAGAEADNDSGIGEISADGRYVAFRSGATNLVPGDTNGDWDVFVRDRQMGTTERVSVDSNEVQANGLCHNVKMSPDGRYVAFLSFATNLVAGDTNGVYDVFVRDRQSGTTELISIDSNGVQGNSESHCGGVSADLRFVTFYSSATNLVPGDTNSDWDVFVRDRQMGTTERVSFDSNGVEANGDSVHSRISADGRYVVFQSGATNLVPGDTNGQIDIFLRDRQAGTTERVSLSYSGAQADNACWFSSVSDDGRYVAFSSPATWLVPGDSWYLGWDVFVRDRLTGTTEIVSVGLDAGASDNSDNGTISADGRYVVFISRDSYLVPDDTNGWRDTFVRDREGGPFFTSVCDPGVGGVMPCPCANPPGGVGRGCNNSSNTGGAILSASGGTYLSSDSLVFTTSGEKPTALSIVLQGTTSNASGLVFGQGVRCVSGLLKRLYTKNASGGSITAPNFGGGELSVHQRSAALGDAIPAGGSRSYLVYYRDGNILGGCPASATFNATHSGIVVWSP